jgi:uncharacterized protein YegP (UPF0339 family)
MFTSRWLVGVSLFVVLSAGIVGQECLAAEKAGKLKFEIYQDAAKGFRWRLKASNDAILATAGQSYKSSADCHKGVERLQSLAGNKRAGFEVYEDKAHQYRWRLKSRNGQVIASSSESYKAKADCDAAIDTIKKGAAKADVEDKTKTGAVKG